MSVPLPRHPGDPPPSPPPPYHPTTTTITGVTDSPDSSPAATIPRNNNNRRLTNNFHLQLPILTRLMNGFGGSRSGRRAGQGSGAGGVQGMLALGARGRRIRASSPFYTCFSCLHVRTVTIFIGVWYLMLYILALSFMAALFMYNKPENGGPDGTGVGGFSITIQTSTSAVEQEEPKLLLASPQVQLNGLLVSNDDSTLPLTIDRRFRDQHLQNLKNQKQDPSTDMGEEEKTSSTNNLHNRYTEYRKDKTNSQFLLLTFCNLLITLLMLYGTLRSKPSYLMPFFILKVFEFCIYCLSMIGLLSTLPNIAYHLQQSQASGHVTTPSFIPVKGLLSLDPTLLSLLAFLFIIASVTLKAYVINVVWNCYKYLMIRNSLRGDTGRSWRDVETPSDLRSTRRHRMNSWERWLDSYVSNNQGNVTNPGVDLPDYETAIRDPRYQKKPELSTDVGGEDGVGAEEQNTTNSASPPPESDRRNSTPEAAEQPDATTTTPEPNTVVSTRISSNPSSIAPPPHYSQI